MPMRTNTCLKSMCVAVCCMYTSAGILPFCFPPPRQQIPWSCPHHSHFLNGRRAQPLVIEYADSKHTIHCFSRTQTWDMHQPMQAPKVLSSCTNRAMGTSMLQMCGCTVQSISRVQGRRLVPIFRLQGGCIVPSMPRVHGQPFVPILKL